MLRSSFLFAKNKRIQEKRKTILSLFLKYASLLPMLKRAISSIAEEQIQEKLSNSPRLPTAFSPILEFKPQQDPLQSDHATEFSNFS